MSDLSKYAPVDPYPELKQIREARATPMSRFEERFAAERTRELAAERTEFRAAQQPEPRLTAAQLSKYEPPNPYSEVWKNDNR